MSFITLKSEYQDNYVGGSESAATFTNYFESPIELGTGNTLQLVSCSIRKTLGYTIVENANDTLLWRIGTGATSLGGTTPFYQHEAVLTPGNYTGDELAEEIAVAFNTSTVLGMFKGLWTCAYTEPPGGGIGTEFSISWSQSTLPTATPLDPIQGALFSLKSDDQGMTGLTGFTIAVDFFEPGGINQAGSRLQVTNASNINQGSLLRQLNTDWLSIFNSGEDFPFTTPITTNIAFDTPTLGQLGDRSIYANGGSISGLCRPVCKILDYNFVRPVDPGLNGDTIQVLNMNNTLGLTETLSMTPLSNPVDPTDWMYDVEAPFDKLGSINKTVFRPGANGILQMNQVLLTPGAGFVEGDIGVIQTDPIRVPTSRTPLATYEVLSVTGTGQMTNFRLLGSGVGYTNLDVVTFVNSRVGELSATGTIEKVQPGANAVGQEYVANNTYNTFTLTAEGLPASGTGATIKVLTVDGDSGILTFELVDRGQDYLETETLLVDGVQVSPAGFKVSCAELIITSVSEGFGTKKAIVLSDGTLGIGSNGDADPVEANFDFGTFLAQTDVGNYGSTAFLLQTDQTTGRDGSTLIAPMQIQNIAPSNPATGGVVTGKAFRGGGLGGICRADRSTNGTGYAVNDTGTIDIPAGSGQTGSGATYIIDSITGLGEIDRFTLIDPGSAYQQLNTYDFIPGGNQPGVGINGTLLIIQGQTQPAARGEGYTVSNNQPTQALIGGGSGFEINILAVASAGGVANYIDGTFSIASGGVGYQQGDEMVVLKGGSVANGMAVVRVNGASPLIPGGGGAVEDMEIVFEATYPATQVAYVRNALALNSPAEPDIYKRYSYRLGEADLQVNLKPNATNTSLLCTVSQMTETAGKKYPEANWRGSTTPVLGLDVAVVFASAGQAGYVFNKSTVKAEIVIDAIRNITVNLYQNEQGGDADAFLAPVPITFSGVASNNINFRPQEAHYPLKPFVSTATSLPFLPTDNTDPAYPPYTQLNSGLAELIIGGVYDIQNTDQPLGRTSSAVGGNTVADELPLPVTGPQSLPFLIKTKPLNSEDTYTPPAAGSIRTVSTFDKAPNIGNAGSVLAMFAAYNVEALATTGNFASDPNTAPIVTANQSTIQVELPNFNIKSYSGESGDRGRAIGVIPSEEFATNEDTGTLHFQSQYSRPIDLNLPFTKPFYSIECRLRNLDGTVVSNLENSTEVTLLVGETEESRQQRIMDKSMERLGSMMANRQDTKISQQTDGSLGL